VFIRRFWQVRDEKIHGISEREYDTEIRFGLDIKADEKRVRVAFRRDKTLLCPRERLIA